MVSASTTTATANILLGRTGGEASYQRLATQLRDAGCLVTERTSSPIGAHSSSEDASGLLDSVDMAFLVVREADDVGSIGPVRPFQRVARDVGIIQGKLGMDRVVLLVEDEVGGLSSDLGVSVLRLPTAGPEAAAPEILQRIRQVVPDLATASTATAMAPLVEPGIHDRLSRIERSRADNEVIPFILFGVVALAALLGALFVALSLLGDGGDDESDPDEVAAAGDGRARLIDVASSLRTSAPVADDGTPGSSLDDESAGTIVSAEEAPSLVLPDPSGPSAAFGGDDQLLPAICRIDLVGASLLDSVDDCDGAGVLVLEGSSGPWHNEVVAIALSDGAVGEVVYEGTGEVQTLDSGLVVLDRSAADFGLTSLTVSFSAAGQHLHLLDSLEPGAREATMTLRLDR